MKNKKIIITIFAVIGLALLMWWGKSVQDPISGDSNFTANQESPLITSERLYDFGTISMASGNVTKIFEVTNSTVKDIIIESVVTSCMCTVAYIETKDGEKGPFGMPGHGGQVPKVNEIIKAGETRNVRVVYDPNAHGPAGVGQIDRLITIADSFGNMLNLEIKALVTP